MAGDRVPYSRMLMTVPAIAHLQALSWSGHGGKVSPPWSTTRAP